MQLRGPGLSNTNTTGVFGNSGENFTLEDVLIYGWGIGANLYGMRGRNIGVYIDNCYGDCLLLRECAFWSSFESIYANSVTGRSIHLSADGGGCQFINFYDRVVDESGGPATIQIDKGNDISVNNCVVYSSRGIGLGGGYGVRLGDGTNTPTRVTLNNLHVRPYDLSFSPTALAKNLYIRGVGHRLVNITTEVMTGFSGSDLQDDSSDSLWVNVNGRHRLRLPTSSGSVASGELYSNSGVVTVKP